MFRRNWCGLPPEAHFPSGLEDLGYFVNDDDEIRSLVNSDYYFNYFLTKNLRVNARQRFEFDGAAQNIIHDRLEKLGLTKTPIPPVVQDSETKHVSVFISNNLNNASRIIVIFGGHAKELGVIAGRIVGGPGGIDKGSMVSVVRAIQETDSVGIILANMGESYWWPEGKRAITVSASTVLPMPSLVHMGIKYDPELNDIPGSESPRCHARTVLDAIPLQHANHDVKVNIIALGESCETIVTLLDEEQTWTTWGSSLQSALFYSPAFSAELKQPGLKDFLATRARGYVVSEHLIDTPLAGPDGNPAEGIPSMGFPCYSSGEPSFQEQTIVSALDTGLAYFTEVATTPNFTNPAVTIIARPSAEELDDAWARLSAEQRPHISVIGQERMKNEVKTMRRWKRFEKTGQVPDGDSDSDFSDDEGTSTLPVAAWPDTI